MISQASWPGAGRGGSLRTRCRASVLLALLLVLVASGSQAAARRACEQTCKRFERKCTATTAKPGRCERLRQRLDRCEERFADFACDATPTEPGVVTVDQARAETKTLPLEGGTLEATGADGTVYSLTIPPGALLVETAITMTPIVSIAAGDLPAGSLLGVDLQPSGLRLYEFAELSIVPPKLDAGASVAGFSYEGDGDDLHRYPASVGEGRILLHVIHFSGAGATICVELCPPPIDPPPQAITESQLEELIAQLDPHDPFFASRLAELLHGYYDLFIAPDLPRMKQDCEFATGRIPKVLAWSRTNQILLNEEGFENENQTIGDAVVASVSNCWAEQTQACLDPSNAYQVQSLLRLARQAQLLGGDPEEFDLSKVRRCSGLWSGTITHERRYEEDADWTLAGHHTRRTRLVTTQTWQVMPNVVAEACEGCQSRVFEASWTGSASEDDLYVTDYGNCTDTVTKQDAVDGTFPSAITIGITRDLTAVYFFRPSSGTAGAPANGDVSKAYEGTHVWCSGYEEPVAGWLHTPETWDFSRFPDKIPFDRADPTVPWTSEGQKVDRQESPVEGGQIVITNTVSWKLTLEPEASQ